MSTFPTSANDSESINQGKSSVVAVHAIKSSTTSSPPLFEITFDRSKNPLLINEDFLTNDKSEIISTTSSSPFFDHSSDSSNEKLPLNKELTESDDGIIFLHDEKRSSSSSLIQTQTKSLIEKKKLLTNEKDIPTTYFYFVMELCQPESLRDRLTQRMIDRHQAWSIFDQIVKGIEYIHSQKLVNKKTLVFFFK